MIVLLRHRLDGTERRHKVSDIAVRADEDGRPILTLYGTDRINDPEFDLTKWDMWSSP